METFIEAYGKRMKRNHETFLQIAKELREKGCKVFAPKDKLINFIKIFKGDRHLIFGFGEVPYNWYLQLCWKPSKEAGSGRTIESRYEDENPYSADYIISKLVPNPDVKNFTNPYYLEELIQDTPNAE